MLRLRGCRRSEYYSERAVDGLYSLGINAWDLAPGDYYLSVSAGPLPVDYSLVIQDVRCDAARARSVRPHMAICTPAATSRQQYHCALGRQLASGCAPGIRMPTPYLRKRIFGILISATYLAFGAHPAPY